MVPLKLTKAQTRLLIRLKVIDTESKKVINDGW